MPKVKDSQKKEEEGIIPLATKNQSAGKRKAENTANKESKRSGEKNGELDVKKDLAELDQTNAETSSKKIKKSEPAAKGAAPAAFQFKITLMETRPLIWRRIQVPKEFTFEELHITIIEAMGWGGGHLHNFKIFGPRRMSEVIIGDIILDEDPDILDEKKEKISEYFPKKTNVAEYEYDFGDCWIHKILFEKEVPRDANGLYPKCLGGKRACPPEDCGGFSGYEDLCKILKNPKHPEYAEMKSWLNDDLFAPEKFDPSKVEFSLV